MGKRVALLIGVSEYGEGFEPLPGSLRDVRAMETALRDPDCGAFEVQPLVNCDRATLETEIEQFFRGKTSDDLLLLYFSGHGDLGSGGMLYQQLHLCTRNTHKQQGRVVESSALSASFLKRQMDLSKAQQIIVILDCCYSGAIADLLKKGEGDIDFGELKARGRVILASSSAAQVALQAVDGLSLYTRYLIEGMTGLAYLGQGNWIVAQDLHAYADRRFEIESGGYRPKIIAEDTGYNLPIVRAPKPDPKLAYRKAVDQIFQELDRETDLDFDGVIEDELDRGSLETRRQRLGLALEEAQAIEEDVQKPYLVRASQRRSYAEYFQKAVKTGSLPTDRARRRLVEIRQNLLLGEADAAQIEQLLIQKLNLESVPLAVVEPQQQPTPDPDHAQVLTPKLSQFEFEVVTVDARGEETNRQAKQAEFFVEDLGNGIRLEMVKIPGGTFKMGSPETEKERYSSESPQHTVNVPSFFMGKFAITQTQYQQIMGSNPANFKGENRPVEQVSWHDAVEFCFRLSQKTGRTYSLPSEAEWEYACRAGTITPFYFGETITDALANYDASHVYQSEPKGEYRCQTIDVGTFPPNAFGLYDMHGNVWEWCEDHGHSNYEDASANGNAWIDLEAGKDFPRVRRGGSWFFNSLDCRSATHHHTDAGTRIYYVGFRVVCSASRTL